VGVDHDRHFRHLLALQPADAVLEEQLLHPARGVRHDPQLQAGRLEGTEGLGRPGSGYPVLCEVDALDRCESLVDAVLGHAGAASDDAIDERPVRPTEAVDLPHARIVCQSAGVVAGVRSKGRQHLPHALRVREHEDTAGVEQDGVDRVVDEHPCRLRPRSQGASRAEGRGTFAAWH
jgi:hypothetical protein